MKNKIINALAATLLLTLGFSKAAAQVEQSISSNHKIVKSGDLLPCDACIPCMDDVKLS